MDAAGYDGVGCHTVSELATCVKYGSGFNTTNKTRGLFLSMTVSVITESYIYMERVV